MKRLDDEPTKSGNRTSFFDQLSNGDSVTQRSSVALLQGLRLCQEAWNPGSPWDRQGAQAALWGRSPGSFLVVFDDSSQNKLLCVSVDNQSKTVQEFPIIHTGSAQRLKTSHLAFSDLLQLVFFYTLSRDVLPLCLSVPSWVCGLNEHPEHAQLGPKAWLCSSPDLLPDTMSPGTPDTQDTVMCTIQLTAASGALCFINPLYLQEHGDDWLTQTSASTNLNNKPLIPKQRSIPRPQPGMRLRQRSETVEEPSASFDSSAGLSVQIPVSPVTPTGVVLRRASSSSPADPQKTASSDPISSPVPQSPHRVSWVEDKIWINPPAPSSLLHPPCIEFDSLSMSSIDEEPDTEPAISPSHVQNSPRLPLADKVKNRISAVGQALGGFMYPQKRLSKRVQEMSERKGSSFAEALRGFVEQTLKTRPGCVGTSTAILQEVRSSLTSLRETLYESVEIQSIIDSMGDVPDIELDTMLEEALHKVALKPLHSHLYDCMKTEQEQDGSLQRLQINQHTLIGKSLEELEGTAGTGVPDAAMLEKIQQRWATMHQQYSPQKKVKLLLKVCKNIYHSMTANAKPGVAFGADDFLPCLTWVLLRSDVVTLQIDTVYMMELLDPSQLQGEGGYYLTSLYASLFYISSFRSRLATRQLSAEAQKSLSQWHRRRTLHCNQSRRSRNRRTIRRHKSGEKVNEDSEEVNTSAVKDKDGDRTPTGDVTKMLQNLTEISGEEKEEQNGGAEDK